MSEVCEEILRLLKAEKRVGENAKKIQPLWERLKKDLEKGMGVLTWHE